MNTSIHWSKEMFQLEIAVINNSITLTQTIGTACNHIFMDGDQVDLVVKWLQEAQKKIVNGPGVN